MRLPVVCRVLTAAGIALAAAVPASGVAAGAVRRSPAATVAPEVVIALGSVSPTIVASGQKLTVTGTIRNTSNHPVVGPLVSLRLGSRRLVSRDDVAAWAEKLAPATGAKLGEQQLKATLPPGASAAFRISAGNARPSHSTAYGALPLSVEAAGAVLHTFAAFQERKEYVPLHVAWLAPLTLDANPALFGPPGTTRTKAWAKTLSTGSRLDRVIRATRQAPVAWAVDPTLVPSTNQPGTSTPGATSSPTASATSPTTGTPATGGPTPEERLRHVMGARIADGAGTRDTLVLPEADADIAATLTTGSSWALVRNEVQAAAPVATQLGGRADIAWPADGQHSTSREDGLKRLYAGQGPAAVIAAQSQLPQPSITADAARRDRDGLAVLAYDDRLSADFATTSTSASSALSSQRLVADTVALLDESPGIARNVLVVAPRDFNPEPAALTTFFATVAAISWLQPTTTADLLDAAAKAPVEPMGTDLTTSPNSSSTPSSPSGTSPTPGGAASSNAAHPAPVGEAAVLTAARAEVLDHTLRSVQGVASIREDGDAFSRVWSEAARQLTSARWRGAPTAWERLHAAIDAAVDHTTSAIKVSPRTVNFLADSGRVQITIVNALDLAVHDITLTVTPDNPRLRVDSPPPVLHIGPRSRTTVSVKVTSLAAGLVPLRTTLRAPDGTVIGRGAAVQIKVSPTGDWVYWTLGAIAGTILLLGIWRTLRNARRHREDGPAAAAKETPA